MRPDGPRPTIIGADAGPEPPYPLRMKGEVVSGFGRGSKELGIPTANLPVEGAPWISTADSGIYFGWAGIQLPASHPDLLTTPQLRSSPSSPSLPAPPPAFHALGWRLYPMVMSIGYNPFYKNTVRSAEVHVLHDFAKDFYGCEMAITILGYVRPEFDYVSVESLVKDIKVDIEVTRNSLERASWREAGRDGWLWGEGEGKAEGKES